MTSRIAYSCNTNLESAATVLRAALHLPSHHSPNNGAQTFITVSRQAGAGGRTFSHQLASRLNESSGHIPWTVWDHELVEKVSADHGIAKSFVEMMEDRHHNWLTDVLDNLSPANDHPDEFKVYKRVASTILTVARAGHAIIVGRGGRFITERLPWGIHIRLVAGWDARVRHISERFAISPLQATHRIREIDAARESFYRRYWPGRHLTPDCFTFTLNAREMSVEEMVDCVLPLIHTREAASAERAAAQQN